MLLVTQRDPTLKWLGNPAFSEYDLRVSSFYTLYLKVRYFRTLIYYYYFQIYVKK